MKLLAIATAFIMLSSAPAAAKPSPQMTLLYARLGAIQMFIANKSKRPAVACKAAMDLRYFESIGDPVSSSDRAQTARLIRYSCSR